MRMLYLMLAIGGFISLQAQDLPRVGRGGFAPSPVTPEQAANLNLGVSRGMYINQVILGFTAAALGMQEGDVLLSIAGVELNAFSDFQSPALQDLRAGDEVTYTVWREGKEKKLTGKVVAKPYEAPEDLNIEYGALDFENGRVRTILTYPKGEGPFPAILFAPGYGCGSLDNNPNHPYYQVVYQLSQLGYAVLRVEKPGTGDYENTKSCQELTFSDEITVFTDGLELLKKHNVTDPERCYVFGHSAGGVTAPFIANQGGGAGVIVYGTTARPWAEYMVDLCRYQFTLDPASVDYYHHNQLMIKLMEVIQLFYYDRLDPATIVQKDPDYAEVLEEFFLWDGGENFFGRSYQTNRDINDMDVLGEWQNVNVPVLSIMGEADYEVVHAWDMEMIAEIVNKQHPDHATYVLIDSTDHGMFKVSTMEETYQLLQAGQIGKYYQQGINPEVAATIDGWIRELEGRN